VDLLVVIVPGKPSIYPDMMTSRMGPETAGTFSHSLRTMRELEQAGVACVNLFAPFAGERRRDSEAGGKMYMKTDTHWGSRAVQLAAKSVADRIRQYPWFAAGAKTAEYVFDTTTVMRVGDVGVMTQLPNFRVRDLRMGFEPEATLCLPVYRVLRDDGGNETNRVPYKDDFGPDTPILVLGDSFSRIYQTDAPRNAGWISHLALELSRPVASIVSDGGASTLVREVLARKVREARREGRRTLLDNRKLVVWEFIERDLRYGAEGWKKIDM
jgi:hypothetical protein